MKSTIVGINSWTQELLLEIISPAIEQLLNRNCTVDPALMPGSFEGVWGIWVITWLRWLSLMWDDDYNTPERKKKEYYDHLKKKLLTLTQVCLFSISSYFMCRYNHLHIAANIRTTKSYLIHWSISGDPEISVAAICTTVSTNAKCCYRIDGARGILSINWILLTRIHALFRKRNFPCSAPLCPHMDTYVPSTGLSS